MPSGPATPTFSTCGLLPREPQRPALSPRHTLSPSLSVLTLPPLLSLPSSQSPTAAGPHTLIHAPAGPPLKPLDHGFYLRGPEVARGEGEEKDEEGEESAGKCVILPEIETSVENRGGGTKAMELGGGSVKGGDVRITGVKEIQIGAWTPAAVRRETTGREKRERQAYEPVKRVLETESMARQQCRKMERKERGPVARMGKTRVLMMAKRLRMRLEDPGMMSHSPWTTV